MLHRFTHTTKHNLSVHRHTERAEPHPRVIRRPVGVWPALAGRQSRSTGRIGTAIAGPLGASYPALLTSMVSPGASATLLTLIPNLSSQ